MSYDLEVWSTDLPDPAAILPQPEGWIHAEDTWEYEGKDWHILLCAVKALSEDAPIEIADLLPDEIFLTTLNFEGRREDQGIALADETARRIARASHGIVVNPQEGVFEDHEGHHLTPTPVQRQEVTLLAFSWWLSETPLVTKAGFSAFLDIVQQSLPEALPRRYGPYPSQHTFDLNQREHFVEYALSGLADHTGFLSWQPTYPALLATFSAGPQHGPSRQGYRARTLTIGVDAAMLNEGQQRRLEVFWQKVSSEIQPFYGDVRSLRHYTRNRSEICQGSRTEHHPVRSGWWKGLPKTLGQAVVLGKPYVALWPKFVKAARSSGTLAFLTTADWSSGVDLSKQIGNAPIALRQDLRPDGYSLRWPFDGPYQ